MKIILPMPHLLHYFNLTLNKVNELPGVELIVVVPTSYDPMAAGGGLNQTRENIKFRIIEMKQFKLGPYYSFKGWIRMLWMEKPNIIISDETFMLPYILSIPTNLVMKLLKIKLIMQSIPYQLPLYRESFKRRNVEPNRIDKLPNPLRFIVMNFGIEYILRRIRAYFNKIKYNRPDAHLNYVDDAFSVYGSYGVKKEKIFVTDNSTDTDALAVSEKAVSGLPDILPESNYRIIHVGRLTKWKRVDLLIRSVAKLKDEFKNIELVVVGEGPDEEYLKSLATELKISERVIFTGGIYDSKLLAQYFKASALYVLAGVGGLSINDAMFFGLPVICSVCDGTEKKLVRNGFNGYLFEESSEEDLIRKISLVLSNSKERKKMGEMSRKIIDNEINIHTVLEKWQQAFDYVMRKK